MGNKLYFDICDRISYRGFTLVKDIYGYWSATDDYDDGNLISKWSFWSNLEDLKKDINDNEYIFRENSSRNKGGR
jgi:hypothetical protein